MVKWTRLASQSLFETAGLGTILGKERFVVVLFRSYNLGVSVR
jgi:hypothetical protein